MNKGHARANHNRNGSYGSYGSLFSEPALEFVSSKNMYELRKPLSNKNAQMTNENKQIPSSSTSPVHPISKTKSMDSTNKNDLFVGPSSHFVNMNATPPSPSPSPSPSNVTTNIQTPIAQNKTSDSGNNNIAQYSPIISQSSPIKNINMTSMTNISQPNHDFKQLPPVITEEDVEMNEFSIISGIINFLKYHINDLFIIKV